MLSRSSVTAAEPTSCLSGLSGRTRCRVSKETSPSIVSERRDTRFALLLTQAEHATSAPLATSLRQTRPIVDQTSACLDYTAACGYLAGQAASQSPRFSLLPGALCPVAPTHLRDSSPVRDVCRGSTRPMIFVFLSLLSDPERAPDRNEDGSEHARLPTRTLAVIKLEIKKQKPELS